MTEVDILIRSFPITIPLAEPGGDASTIPLKVLRTEDPGHSDVKEFRGSESGTFVHIDKDFT